MNKITFLTISLLFLLSACRNTQKQNGNSATDLRIIDIDKFGQKDPISGCMNEIRIIPLETNENSLMGTIKKIEICEPYIFILDHNKNFFTYNTEGSFLFKVFATGKGPDELNDVTNFYVDIPQKCIGIYDYLKQKIFQYDFQGKLLGAVDCETKLLVEAREINMLSDNKLLIALDYTPELKHSFVTLNSKDYSQDKFYKPFPYVWKGLSGDGTRPKQTQNQSGTYIISMLSDTIYHYENNDFVPAWVLKSKLQSASHKHVNPDLVSDYGDVVQQAYRHEGMSRGLLNILLTDSIGYTLYYYNGKVNNLFWNLQNGKGCISESFGGYPNVFRDFRVLTTSGNNFVGSVAAHKIDLAAITRDCSPEVVKSLSNIKEDDNPVIVFYPISVK